MNEKVGRNDPCPCGSGKKYKNCHWGKEIKKTYTAAGKRKFKAKLLSSSDTRSQSVFGGSTPQAPTETPSFESLKVRFAKSDFRVKQGEGEETALPFAIPSPGAETMPSSETSSEGSSEPLSIPEGEFEQTSKDYRVEKKEKNE